MLEPKEVIEVKVQKTFTCPICNTEIDSEKYEVMRRLHALGYMALDLWIRCPKCKYEPCFGKELQSTKPIYWRPGNLPESIKKNILSAFKKHNHIGECVICGGEMELHKVWVNSYIEQVDAGKYQIWAPQIDGKMKKTLTPISLLTQYKCVRPECKYIRYLSF